MIKSVKGLFVLSVITAILFIINTFSYIEFTGIAEFQFPRIIMYFASFLAVYNAGILTQKYIQTRREK